MIGAPIGSKVAPLVIHRVWVTWRHVFGTTNFMSIKLIVKEPIIKRVELFQVNVLGEVES